MIRYILVDDDPEILKWAKADLDTIAKDYELKHVASYSSSKKAYENIQKDDFDLLIVDFEMPVYNGIELAKKIATHKKIVFLTSTTNNEKKVINNLDISGFLSKPFDVQEFESILKNKVINKINTVSNNQTNLINLLIGSNRDIQFNPTLAYYISSSKFNNEAAPVKNCVHIYGKNDKILYKNVRLTINELYKKLESYNFNKVSQSTIINMAHLKERDNIHINLFNTEQTFEVTAKEKMGLVAKLRSKFKGF
jgi:YesN/AraC family two-component response regulator